MQFPLTLKALKVTQPLGTYYVTVIPARVLLQVAFSDALTAIWSSAEQTYKLDGTQRLRDPKRLKPVASYIDREDAAFPNSIILAANYRRDTGLLEEENPDDGDDAGVQGSIDYWFVHEAPDGCHSLTIPSAAKLASVIDGQHRLFAFAEALPKRLDMELVCSVFLDLPKPYQAQLFATINSNQKPVDKSLTYEMFGYNIEEEEESFWSPDKLAVFLTRKLAVDQDSPLNGRIQIAPVRDDALNNQLRNEPWRVSTAVIVEAIMRLFTSNPKADTAALLKDRRKPRASIGDMRADRSPLRNFYLGNKDAVIYALVKNYLVACDEVFWARAPGDSFIIKTVGVQALLDVLKRMARDAIEGGDIRASYFSNKLSAAGQIDFTEDRFKNASGAGRSIIRRALEDAMGMAPLGRPKME